MEHNTLPLNRSNDSRPTGVIGCLRRKRPSRKQDDVDADATHGWWKAPVSQRGLQGKEVFLYAYRACAGEETVKTLKKFTSDWLAKLDHANP